MQNFLDKATNFYADLPIERARLLEISASMHHDLGEYNIALRELNTGLKITEEQGLNREQQVLFQTKKRVLSSMGNNQGIVDINEQLLLMNQKKVSAQNRDL